MNPKTMMEVIKMYEDKLREYMSDEDYRQFASEVSKKIILAETENSKESNFTQMLIDNLMNIIDGENIKREEGE